MRVGIVGGGFAGLALRCLSVLGVRDRVATEPWSRTPATVRTAEGRVLARRTLAQLTGGDEYATVPRTRLLAWLVEQLPPDRLLYGSAVTSVNTDGVLCVDGSEQHSISSSPRTEPAESSGPCCGRMRRHRGPPGITGWAWIVDRELATGFGLIWGRTTSFGILPLVDGRTYIYGGTERLRSQLHDHHGWPAPIPMLIDAAAPEQVVTPEIFEAPPPRQLLRGRVALIGDAGHTMRPIFGQGAALAMEDAITLARCGPAGLVRRRTRMRALYAAAKAGSYFASPRLRVAEKVRDLVLVSTPDCLFGFMAGSVSRWQPPSG